MSARSALESRRAFAASAVSRTKMCSSRSAIRVSNPSLANAGSSASPSRSTTRIATMRDRMIRASPRTIEAASTTTAAAAASPETLGADLPTCSSITASAG